MIYRLIALSGPLQGQRITVEKKPMVIGREGDCAVVISDPEIAKKHAVIEQTAVGVFVHDLGFTTRVLVNGREVHESRLKHGDEVEIGHTRFVLQALVESEVEKPAAGGGRRKRMLWTALAVAAGLAGVSLLMRGCQSPPKAAPKPGPKRVSASGPTATVERVAPATTAVATVAARAATNEIEAMRRDLVGIRQIVNELATRQATATVAAAHIEAPPAAQTEPAPETEPAEAPLARAQRLLQEARSEAAAGNLAKADGLLASLQKDQSDFLPAYEERAALFEQRGMTDEAMEQWLEVIDRGATGTAYEKAADEYFRLDRLEVRQSSTVPIKVRILSSEQQKFPESEDHAEMRAVNVQLVAEPGTNAPAEPLNAGDVQVEVLFFDQETATGRIVPARALAPKARLRPGEPWRTEAPNTVTATYVVSEAARAEDAQHDRHTQYYGYVVRVYYRNELQDEDARPKSLLHYSTGGRRGRKAS